MVRLIDRLKSRHLKSSSTLDVGWGTTSRDYIHRLGKLIYPYARIILPNFKAVHYFYIITMTFLASVLIYPVKNIPYIDALFLAAGAATQSGLNTIDLNNIDLYQQIVIYVVCIFTTPIFIHGSLLFVRLYWFERQFDDIKVTSKLNFKMRRSATLAARGDMPAATTRNTASNRILGLPGSHYNGATIDSVLDNNDSTPQSSSTVPKLTDSSENSNDNNVAAGIQNNDQDDNPTERNKRPSSPSDLSSADPLSSHQETEGIRFGDLPHPSNIRKKEVDPSDMYKSIAMLRNNQQRHSNHHSHNDDNGDDDDVLIIKPPNEIEKGGHNPIYTTKSQIHFKVGDKPIKRWRRPLKRSISRRKQWEKLRKSLSSAPISPSRRKSFKHSDTDQLIGDDEEADENMSIDSETRSDSSHSIDGTNEDISSFQGMSDTGDEDAVTDGDTTNDENEEHHKNFKRAHTNQVEAPVAEPEVVGFKRANTLDIAPGKEANFIKSPSFDRIIRARKKNKHLRKLRSPSFHRTHSSIDSDSDEEDLESEKHSLKKTMSTNYLSWVPTVGRNSAFIHMTDQQKDELGGVEYRAVKLLIKILVIYYIGFHVIALICLLPWILVRKQYINIVREAGITPTWWAFFTASSSFNDLGYTLTSNSMSSFADAIYILMIMSFFIVIGNTGFPVLLRFIIWILFKFSHPLSLFKESLGFLLDHPRRCFTLLFPSMPTWWLFSILVVLNGVDWVLFIILDLKNKYLSSIPTGFRVFDGLFQAFCTRTAGFTVIDLARLHAAVQVSYMLMMYISVLPLAISIRRTNVYEEQSLGVYLKDDSKDDSEETPKSFIGAHLRNQLSFDLWFIFLGLFIICIAEGGKLDRGDLRFSVFTILFEIISAYGTVGMSLGYPTNNSSFSRELNTISKLVIIAMMIRGRHRGLPYTLDRAIMLPDAAMRKRDELQQYHALQRHQTMDTMRHSHSGNDGNFLTRTITRSLQRRRPSFFGAQSTSSHVPGKNEVPETPHYKVTDVDDVDDIV
ncbi:uncharacterized protein PRCAT00005204001 [Priceomyces carsonii]|uniref:uncharacterized protein n=1 Tax=Priceomyces carsonii TaxID=28549 RepID=UPI002EDA6A52|nr:unnamed protein product [Priceomyces carsonii]